MTPPILKPPCLQADDAIGVFSPSFPAAGRYPQRLTRAHHNLEHAGYILKLAPHARAVTGHTAGSPAERAADLHALLLDPEVKAIMAASGGDNSNELLPLLDWDLFRSHPKIILGHSDVTVLLNAITVRTSLVTFHGPMLIHQWAEFPDLHPFTLRWFHRVLGEANTPGALAHPDAYTDEQRDWETPDDALHSRTTRPAPPWQWLRPGRAAGPLLGGHLSSLHLLAGTPYWPDFDGAIFFWEAVWAHESLAAVHRSLSAFANLGVFDRIAGMVIGLPDALDPPAIASTALFLTEFLAPWSFPTLFGPLLWSSRPYADPAHRRPLHPRQRRPAL